MAKKPVSRSSEFHVVLQGLKLEPDVENWRFGNVLTRSLADHTPINYVSVLSYESRRRTP
jgi:hypothetical protein